MLTQSLGDFAPATEFLARCFEAQHLGASTREVRVRVLSSRSSAASVAGSAGCSRTSLGRRIGLRGPDPGGFHAAYVRKQHLSFGLPLCTSYI